MRYAIRPFVLVGLVAGTVVTWVALGVRPRSRLQWLALWLTVMFLVWLLGGFTHLRSR